MTTMDLIGKLLQAIFGLVVFGGVVALLLAGLDREDSRSGRSGLITRIVIAAALGVLALLARLLYGVVPWMTQGLANGIIVLAVLGVVVIAIQYGLGFLSSRLRSVVVRLLAAVVVAAIAVVAPMAGDGAIEALDWLTPDLATGAALVGWPLVAGFVASALLEFAPPRFMRRGRLLAWLLVAVAIVVSAIAHDAASEQQLGAWPWAAAAAVSAIALLSYASTHDDEAKPAITFLAPVVVLLTIGLLYPAVRTTLLAFTDASGSFNGVDNFVWMFTQEQALWTLGNTIVWVVLVPLLSTVIGLAYAVFIDKSRGEKIYKMLVFMPMAISFVGAGIIWKFMYAYRGAEQDQIGLVNAALVAFGGAPQQILQNSPWNTLALIAVMVWIQTGFAMIVLSAAIKGVPVEQIEAAELDGANPWQRFMNVTVPGIRSSLVVVVTTISIATLKVFDIVRTMTAGNFNTSVVANEMYTQAFRSGEPGRGAALALVLFLLVLPIVVYNVRVLNQQREIR